MPKTKPYRLLHDRVIARPGAAERIAKLRQETLAEIPLYELQISQGTDDGHDDGMKSVGEPNG